MSCLTRIRVEATCCPSPGCPHALSLDLETRVHRCTMHGPMVMDIELVTEEPPALEPPVSWAEFQDALSIAEDGYLRLPEYQWVAALAGAERTIAAFRSWAALNL